MTETSVLGDSVIAYSENLAIFGRVVQDVSIRKVTPISHSPSCEFSNNLLKFDVKSSGSSYIDLSKTMLRISGRIMLENNGSITEIERIPDKPGYRMKIPTNKPPSSASGSATDNDGEKAAEGSVSDKAGGQAQSQGTPQIVSPENNFLNTAFERIDVWLGDELVSHSQDNYAYLSYFKAIQASPEEKRSALQMQMYFESEDEVHPDSGVNWTGSEDITFQKRAAIFGGSREVTMTGRLASDVFSVERLLPHGVGLKIVLYPHKPQFCLVSPDLQPPPAFKFVITRATLLVATVEVSPEIVAAHDQVLLNQNAYFPYKSTDIRMVDVPQGAFSVEIPNPFNGRQPSELVVGIVDSQARHGHYGMSSLRFERCNLRLIQCVVDNQHLGHSPIHVRYGETELESSFQEGYNSLRGFGMIPNAMPFSMNTYFNKLALYRFVSQGDEAAGSGFGEPGQVLPLRRTGNVKLVLQFEQALDTPKTVIMYGQFASGFKITSNRDVLLM